MARLERLKALRVRLALDDFGTGYSSLAYLRRFPIDMLKIDKSFVHEVMHGPEASAVTRAIVQLGTTLRLETVAEGIEAAGQVRELRDSGCLLGQGYYFARPLERDEADALVGSSANGRHTAWPLRLRPPATAPLTGLAGRNTVTGC
jgi:EAL domain-containing protein (putative c-di-GMP-specific phosphodiesterase class I)